MIIVFIVAMLAWMSVLTRFVTKLSKETKEHKAHLYDISSKIRGLKLAVRVLGARLHSDPD